MGFSKLMEDEFKENFERKKLFFIYLFDSKLFETEFNATDHHCTELMMIPMRFSNFETAVFFRLCVCKANDVGCVDKIKRNETK